MKMKNSHGAIKPNSSTDDNAANDECEITIEQCSCRQSERCGSEASTFR